MMKVFINVTIAATLILGGCHSNQAQQPAPLFENVDAKRFKDLVDAGKGIVLDVRTPEEISLGYINNASTINFYDEEFVAKINLIPKNKPVYVYCAAGSRSAEAASLLQQNGFVQVYNLVGGLAEWNNNSFPVVRPDKGTDEKIQQMTLEEFNEILKTDKPVLVDFHTIWCAPCRKMAPIIDGLEEKYKGKAVVLRIDVDKSKALGQAYEVYGVPVFVLFLNGQEKWRQNGIISESDLVKTIEGNY